jgi:DNA-directed RNA polymerase specialized sigma24 family protein
MVGTLRQEVPTPCVRSSEKMLNSEDYKQLRELAKSRKLPAGKVKRAKIILSSNQGYTAREIATKLDCNERTALRWINRFNRYGGGGPRRGAA